MRRDVVVLALAALLAAGMSPVGGASQQPPAPAPETPAPAPPPPAPAVLEGAVRGTGEGGEAASLPLAEAWVEALDGDDRVVARTVTSEDGAFRIVLPPPGPWRLRVSRRDFLPELRGPETVSAGDTLKVQVLLRRRPPVDTAWRPRGAFP